MIGKRRNGASGLVVKWSRWISRQNESEVCADAWIIHRKNMCLKSMQEISGITSRNILKPPINFAHEWNANILFAANPLPAWYCHTKTNTAARNVEHDRTKITMHVYRYRPTKLRLNHWIDWSLSASILSHKSSEIVEQLPWSWRSPTESNPLLRWYE